MDNASSVQPCRWDRKYHVVWIPRCQRQVFYGQLHLCADMLVHSTATPSRVTVCQNGALVR